ncbi:MAG: hypothetical protein RMJ98_19160 [Myxococcales bacterium]|nr:hypothetical protein [Polyangiaceae bacterium]MDW8251419.1 hypothetical protein [Myxococcales bacterium]
MKNGAAPRSCPHIPPRWKRKRAKPLRDFHIPPGRLTVQGKVYNCKPATFEVFDDVVLDLLLPYETSDVDRDLLFKTPLDAKQVE